MAVFGEFAHPCLLVNRTRVAPGEPFESILGRQEWSPVYCRYASDVTRPLGWGATVSLSGELRSARSRQVVSGGLRRGYGVEYEPISDVLHFLDDVSDGVADPLDRVVNHRFDGGLGAWRGMAFFGGCGQGPVCSAPAASSGTITAGMSSFRRKGLMNLTHGEFARGGARPGVHVDGWGRKSDVGCTSKRSGDLPVEGAHDGRNAGRLPRAGCGAAERIGAQPVGTEPRRVPTRRRDAV